MNKVAIVGAQELTRDNAPYNDLDYEIWSFSDWLTAKWLKRCDALIEIHLANVYMNHPRTPGYWDALQQTDIPVYMYPVADPRVPNSILYPLDAVLALVSTGRNQGAPFKPLNSSVAYAMGLAILKEYDVIDVYGVEMAHSSEYMAQQPIFAFWSGVAAAKGIRLNINCSDGLFAQPLYGSEDLTETAKIFAMIEGISKQVSEARKLQDMGEGALQALRQLAPGGGRYV